MQHISAAQPRFSRSMGGLCTILPTAALLLAASISVASTPSRPARRQASLSSNKPLSTSSLRKFQTAAMIGGPTLQGPITTVAGGVSGTLPALSSNLLPVGIARSADGNIYVADLHNIVVRRIDPAGNITTSAGNDSIGSSGDGGPATQAQLDGPYGVALDAAGNLYIADSLNNLVRRVTPAGIITTFAGSAVKGAANNGDGLPATDASLSDPERVSVDPSGNVYIADVNHGEIRKVDSSGTINKYAGNGGFSYGGDGGPATSANFAGVGGMTWMPDGSLLIADTYNARVRRVDTNGIISTVAGSGTVGETGDGGPATAATMNQPVDVASDGTGGFWIAESQGGRVRYVDPLGTISTVDIPGLLRPQGVVAAGNGGVLVSDINSRIVLFHGADGQNVTVAGNGSSSFCGIGVPATYAALSLPTDVAFDRLGNMYIADQGNYMVRQVSPAGIITTVAGSGQAPCRTPGCQQDNGDGGPATQAILASPIAVAVDDLGNIYVAEHESPLVRRIDPQGVITTFAGGGGTLGDGGPATSARLASPYGLTIAPDGAVVIADTFNNRARRVDASGIITTIAGNGTGGFAGDNGPAAAAELYHPSGVTYDSAGNLYIADFGNLRVRKVTPAGIITTVAGNGQPDTGGTGIGDGLPAIAAALTPYHVAADNAGNLFISDQTDQRIREVDTTGTMSTVTGTGRFGYSGDNGPATSAQIWGPSGISFDPGGALYFADEQNSRVRGINVPVPVPLTSVVSSKVHGSAGTFDLPLPIGGSPGVECRSGGANGEHTLVFTFGQALQTVGGASITRGRGSVSGSGVDPKDAHLYVVNLTGVANAQIVTVTLTSVTDSSGDFSASVSQPMAVLLGDTTANGAVNSSDIAQVQSQSGQPVSSSNFRADVTLNGAINSSDISLVQSASGTALP